MAAIRPFRALRPAESVVSRIAALPYDAYSGSEARQIVETNPFSFLKIDRAETQFPEGTDLYAQKVYDRARDTLVEMEEAGELVQDDSPCYYIYAQTMEGRTQTGLVCCVSIDDYLKGVVKRHENTRKEKELDRIRHVDTCNAHTGPVFLAYRGQSEFRAIIETARKGRPLYDFVSSPFSRGEEVAGEQKNGCSDQNSVRHQVWRIEDEAIIEILTAYFKRIPALYIADGHHRAAAAVKVGLRRRVEQKAWQAERGEHWDERQPIQRMKQKPDCGGMEESGYFLAVLFPAEELKIYDYNRVVHKIAEKGSGTPGGGIAEGTAELVKKLGMFFVVSPSGEESGNPEQKNIAQERFHPSRKGEIGMYLSGRWYCLQVKPELVPDDPVEGLDVQILQRKLLEPVFGITDPKTDSRLQFVGGIRGLEELERIVNREGEAAAFAMYPTSMEELLRVADAGKLMPPKSTWFEPKLLSGLFIHKF